MRVLRNPKLQKERPTRIEFWGLGFSVQGFGLGLILGLLRSGTLGWSSTMEINEAYELERDKKGPAGIPC